MPPRPTQWRMNRSSNLRQRAGFARAARAEPGPFGLNKLRMVEIGIALLLTLAALIFVGLTVWAVEQLGIQVTDAWARPSVGQSAITAAYMTIANDGATDDVLEGVRSPKVKVVEVHQTTATPDGVLQPGGAHLMLIGVEEPLQAGDQVMLTLEFAKAAPLEIAVPVITGAPDKD